MYLDCSPVVLTVPVKVCSQCGEVRPATREHFRLRPNGTLFTSCRDCGRASAKRWRDANPDLHAKAYQQWYQNNRDHRAESMRSWRCANREHVIAYRKANRERRTAYNKAWLEAHPGYGIKWYWANYEHNSKRARTWREANKEYLSRYKKAWRETNKDIVAANNHLRRARKKLAPGTHSAADLAAIRAAQTDKKGRLICWACGKPIIDTPHLDHWIPLAKGGTNDPGNLRYMHAKCNLIKRDRLPHELGRLI